MEKITSKSIYEHNTTKLIKFMLRLNFILLSMAIFLFVVVDIENIKKINLFSSIDGINFVLGLISIPCCVLYYRMYKHNEFFILTLSYIGILIEYIYINYLLEVYGVNSILITFPFVIRIILLSIAIFNESKIAKVILNHRRISIFFVVLINVIGIQVELNFDLFGVKKQNLYFEVFNVSIVIIYIILLCLLSKICKRKNEFLYTIFIISISLFTIRRVLYFNSFTSLESYIVDYNKIISSIAYLVLLIGLYIEVIRKTNESERLNIEINNKQEIISKISKEYKEVKEIELIRNQFFANLSHEIKTPINIIYSCIQFLDLKKNQGVEELANTYEKYDYTIKQNCYRMIRLVNNLVDMTKIDSGYMTLTFENCDIVNLIEEITLSIIPYVNIKNINVIFDTYVEEIEVKCDPESIERIILNLLSNAIKFTNDGGNILVIMDCDDEWVTVKVKDSGIGVPSELKQSIFERFVQGDKSFNRQKEGSGIGLALVKSLVELHNGKIYLSDNNDVGSEFVIKLPNIKNNDHENIMNVKKMNANSKPMVEKIQIEFSDIYELF